MLDGPSVAWVAVGFGGCLMLAAVLLHVESMRRTIETIFALRHHNARTLTFHIKGQAYPVDLTADDVRLRIKKLREAMEEAKASEREAA